MNGAETLPEHPGRRPDRQRLRFEGSTRRTAPDGRCRITVRLEWCGRALEGEAEGLDTHHGRVRAAAEAALAAALAAAWRRVHLALLGVKSVRAFDGWVVVVRLNALLGERPLKLLGAASCEEEVEVERAAALAVLDATNRVLEGEGPGGG